MKLVYIRVRSKTSSPPSRTVSTSVSLIRALHDRHLLSSAEQWQFIDGDVLEPAECGRLPLKIFPAAPELLAPALIRHFEDSACPDILWVEGTAHPAHFDVLFRLCGSAFKIVYSKYWKPWQVERLDRYDLCLLDDEHQEEQVHQCWPSVRCGVWDKLVDYETVHRPLHSEKVYDVCYVAYLRARKNHDLLFRALARLDRSELRCVCVGDDRDGNRRVLERLAADLKLAVEFTGDQEQEEVNRYVNRSRIGVVCSRRDAAPRVMLEYMAADVPALVSSELTAGARYVGGAAGLICPPEQFHLGIAELLGHLDRYSPRACYLAHYSIDHVVERFVQILSNAGLELRGPERAEPQPVQARSTAAILRR
jgi:glycosyltransferase involved in cell wall biosynthesis